MHIKQLEYFIEVSKSSSFSQASQRLYVSQQTLSAAIRSLEEELGVVLLSRSNQGISLTNEGASILKDAEHMVEVFHRWKGLGKPSDSDISGDVFMIAPVAMVNAFIVDVILACREQYPAINIHLFESRDAYLYNQVLKDSRIRIIINSWTLPQTREFCIQFASKQHFELTELFKDEYHVFLNADSPFAAEESISINSLRSLTLACYPDQGNGFPFPELYDAFSDTPPYHLSSQASIFRLIANNPNIAAVFSAMALHNTSFEQQHLIVSRPVRELATPIDGFIMHPANNRCTIAELKVIELITKTARSFSETN